MRIFYGISKRKHTGGLMHKLRENILFDLKKHHGEVEDCIIFGLSSYYGAQYTFSLYYGKWSCLLSSPDICVHSKRL
jgi:hypothetical protein